MSRSRGCCLPSHNTQDSPTPKTHPAPNVSSAKTEKPCLRESVVLEQVHCSTPHLCEGCFLLTLIQVRRETQEKYLDSFVLSSLVDTVTVFDSHLEKRRRRGWGKQSVAANKKEAWVKKYLHFKSSLEKRSVSLGRMDNDYNHFKRDYLQGDIENRDEQPGMKAE